MNNNEKIIEIIKNRRTSLKLSLSEVARRMGIPKSTLSRYESLQRQFPLDQISNIAAVLDLSPEYILGISSGDKANSPHTSSYINKTVETMEQLDESRQQVVLATANVQLKEQNDSKAKVIPMKKKSNVLTDEALQEAVDTAVAFDGIPLNEQEKEAAKALIRRFWEEDHPED